MNLENTNTPDSSSGHGQSTATPDSSASASPAQTSTEVSGHGGQTPNEVSGHGASSNQSVGSQETAPAQTVDPNKQYEELRNHFSSKITELGQANSEYKKQLEQQQQREEQFRNSMAQALGFGQDNQTQQVDPLNLLMDNPDDFAKFVAEKTGLASRLDAIDERERYAEVRSYIGEQTNRKMEIETGKDPSYAMFTDDMRKKITDLTPYLPPRVQQIQQSLQDQFVSNEEKLKLTKELDHLVAGTVNQMGGYDTIARLNFANMFMENPSESMQQMAQMYNQKQFAAQRAGKYGGGYTGGAPVASGQPTSAVPYVEETIRR